MNKFDDVVHKYKNILENNITGTKNPILVKAVEDLQNALKNSGTLSGNRNASDLASELFDTPTKINTVDEPLKNIFDKILKNPTSPDITEDEKNMLKSLLEPDKKEEETDQKKQEGVAKTSDSGEKSDTTNNTTSQQPNAAQYNPYTQS
jgi:hypothetical protein